MLELLLFVVPFLLGAADDDEPPMGRLPHDERDPLSPARMATGDAPVTIQMMKEPQPLPELDEPAGAWQRKVIDGARADRTQSGAGWEGEEADLAIPAQVREQLEAGAWLVARLWLSSDYAPAQDKNRPAAAFWSWSGPRQPGSTLPIVLDSIYVVNQDRPRMDWVKCRVRINIAGEIELAIIYPGETHEGKQRGRKYLAVFEWDVLPAPPS